MAKTINFKVEVIDGKLWGHVKRSSGDPAETPINEVLRWVVEQINFGNWACTPDASGDVTTIVLGAGAAADEEGTTVDAVKADIESRLRSVNFCGLFARAREEGINPSTYSLAETVRMTATEEAYSNTELHYAFELLDILARIRSHTFVFSSPPIHGITSSEVITLLREATRAYLFNLRRSCVALCRALLEAGLKERVSRAELLQAQLQDRIGRKQGHLECLINLGVQPLGPDALEKAHSIRAAGNDAMHGIEPSDERAWAVLMDTREVLEKLLKGRHAV